VQRKQSASSSGRLGRLGRILIFACLAVAPACATSQSEVPVIHSRAAVTPILRACLVVFQGQLGSASAQELLQALSDALQPRTSALVSMLVSGLEFDDPTARAHIDTFGPDGIILISPTGEVSHEEGGAVSITYDVQVKAPKEKRIVWHANLVSESGSEVMARDLVEHLTTAGLLTRNKGGEPAPGKTEQRSK
jgi:hypothetical protein